MGDEYLQVPGIYGHFEYANRCYKLCDTISEPSAYDPRALEVEINGSIAESSPVKRPEIGKQ